MDFELFIRTYNAHDVVILLEGKRNVQDEDKEKLVQLGKLLATHMPLAHFRSGNAPGADELFAQGVVEVDASRFHLILPDAKHRQRSRVGLTYFSLDDIQLTNEDQVVYEARKYKSMGRLVDRYLEGHRDRTTPKITPIDRKSVV